MLDLIVMGFLNRNVPYPSLKAGGSKLARTFYTNVTTTKPKGDNYINNYKRF